MVLVGEAVGDWRKQEPRVPREIGYHRTWDTGGLGPSALNQGNSWRQLPQAYSAMATRLLPWSALVYKG